MNGESPLLRNFEKRIPACPSETEFSGLMRLRSIVAPHGPIPVCKSTWWAGVKSGRYPKPVKLGPRITAWRVEDIRALIQAGFD